MLVGGANAGGWTPPGPGRTAGVAEAAALVAVETVVVVVGPPEGMETMLRVGVASVAWEEPT